MENLEQRVVNLITEIDLPQTLKDSLLTEVRNSGVTMGLLKRISNSLEIVENKYIQEVKIWAQELADLETQIKKDSEEISAAEDGKKLEEVRNMLENM